MKHLFFKTLSFFLLLSLPTYAQTADNNGDNNHDETLYLYTNSSTEATVYSIDEIKKITFGDNGIQIWNTQWPTEFAYTNCPVLSFSKRESIPDNVNPANQVGDAITIDRTNATLIVNSATNFVKVQLFDIQGHIIVNKSSSSKKCIISLTDVSPGIYIVRVVSGNRIFSKMITR